MDHITATKEVIKHIGEGDMLHVSGENYIWRGDGVWRKSDDREVKQAVHVVAATPQ